MPLDATSQLGQLIGQQHKSINVLRENINPDDPLAALLVPFNMQVRLTGSFEIYQNRVNNIFIVGHPVYGVIGDYPIGPWMILSHPLWSMLNQALLSDRDEDVYERKKIHEATL